MAQVWDVATAPRVLARTLRGAQGRESQPSAGLIDSQRVKPPGVGGERSDDGAKQLTGRKRPRRVDTQGRVLAVAVQPADVMDRDGVMGVRPPRQSRRSGLASPRGGLRRATTAKTKARMGSSSTWDGRRRWCGRLRVGCWSRSPSNPPHAQPARCCLEEGLWNGPVRGWDRTAA